MDRLLISLVIAFLLIVYIVWKCYKRNGDVRVAIAKTMVVLGSGGHTSEMISLIKGLDNKRYNPFVFVYANTDNKSIQRVKDANMPFEYTCRIIPRSREVGQSYFSSILSTIKAFVNCISMVYNEKPSLLLVNGPGTCVPVVLSVVLFRMFNVMQCKIVYIESFCRVEKLSVTGYILYYLADSFVVQWPQLQKKYTKSVYLGTLM